jgi:hypothetical protein
MPVYICRRPNGDFSIVSAASKQRAIELLDEVGNAEGSPISMVKDFMIHFELKDSGELQFESFGEATEEKIMEWGYPLVDGALAEIADQTLTDGERANAIQEAVAGERGRVVHEGKEPETELGKRIKRLSDVPAGMINTIVSKQARKALGRFRGNGKVQ